MEANKKDNWYLLRTNNGEWISNDKVVYLDSLTSVAYQSHAKLQGLEFSLHRTLDGMIWAYKYQVEQIKLAMQSCSNRDLRKLKISPSAKKNI